MPIRGVYARLLRVLSVEAVNNYETLRLLRCIIASITRRWCPRIAYRSYGSEPRLEMAAHKSGLNEFEKEIWLLTLFKSPAHKSTVSAGDPARVI